MTEESIFLAILRLKKHSHSLTSTDTPNTPTDTQLNRVSAGVKTLAMDSDNSSQPISKIKKETIIDATYSMRA